MYNHLEIASAMQSVSNPTSHLKMTRPPGFFLFIFFILFGDQSWKKMVYKQQNVEGEVWGRTRLQNADTCVSKKPKYTDLYGEDNECRSCKHCGCTVTSD